MVAFGRPQGERGSYKQWEEGGIAPHVVFEVLSPGNRPPEMKRKFEFYERYGVEEYYLYDPFSGKLEGWLRRGDKLKKIARMRGFVSPRLGIRFEPGKGQDNLTIIGRDGEPFPTPLELSRRRGGSTPRRGRARSARRAPRGTPRSSASWGSSRIDAASGSRSKSSCSGIGVIGVAPRTPEFTVPCDCQLREAVDAAA